jgi:hypothetical protein
MSQAPAPGLLCNWRCRKPTGPSSSPGEAPSTVVGEGILQTFGLTGTDLSGRSVSLANSLPGKIIGGLAGSHPNLPNTAGKSGDPNDDPTSKASSGQQSSGNGNSSSVHNGDVTGVHAENQIFNGNQNADDVNRAQSQALAAGGGGWDRTSSWGSS